MPQNDCIFLPKNNIMLGASHKTHKEIDRVRWWMFRVRRYNIEQLTDPAMSDREIRDHVRYRNWEIGYKNDSALQTHLMVKTHLQFAESKLKTAVTRPVSAFLNTDIRDAVDRINAACSLLGLKPMNNHYCYWKQSNPAAPKRQDYR